VDLSEISKRIVEGELMLTQAVRKGHKPYYGDELENVRTEFGVLRCLYFGNESKFCNPRYKK
jgi:hypothetical protein